MVLQEQVAAMLHHSRFFTKQEITEQLPILERLVLQGMLKLFIIKMNNSNECIKQALELYDLNNYILKPVATDFRCYIYFFGL